MTKHIRQGLALLFVLGTLGSVAGCQSTDRCELMVKTVRKCQPDVAAARPGNPSEDIALCQRALRLYPDAQAEVRCADSAKGDCDAFNRCQRQIKLDELVYVLQTWQAQGRLGDVTHWCKRYRGALKQNPRYEDLCADVVPARPTQPKATSPQPTNP